MQRLIAWILILTALWAAPVHAQPQRVAVLEFDGDGSIDVRGLQFLADQVREAALRQLGAQGWEVVTRENMLVLLETNTKDLAECVGECEVETGRLLGAHRVVAGSQLMFGSTYELVLRSYDTATGRLLTSESVSASDLDELRGQLGPASERLFASEGGVRSATDIPDVALGDRSVEVNAGSETDLAALAAAAAQQAREREELEQRQADLEAQRAAEAQRLLDEQEDLQRREREVAAALEADRLVRRDEATVEIREAAAADWMAIVDLREYGAPEVVPVIEAFVDKYGGVTATVDGIDYAIEIAAVEEARAWLTRNTLDLGGEIIDAYGYEMVWIEAGEFWMGSPEDEKGRLSNETRHLVELTSGFAVGTTEVTQTLYEVVMGESPSQFEGPQRPVEQVSWYHAVEFCNRLSEMEGIEPAYYTRKGLMIWDKTSSGYRLPSEAEWEYAARAGQDFVYAGSDDSDTVAWRGGNSRRRTHEVGQKQPNAWGLYDMSGNVWEWVWDKLENYPSKKVVDPDGRFQGNERIYRGGSWYYPWQGARVACRGHDHEPSSRSRELGFRIARFLSEP